LRAREAFVYHLGMREQRTSGDAAVETVALEIGERRVDLRVRRSLRARRLSLRIDPAADGIELVLPRGVGLGRGLDFARRQSQWIDRRLARLPARRPFVDGTAIPLLGSGIVISHRPDARRGVWREEDRLCVSGDGAHVARRVTDWLKRIARSEIEGRARLCAERVGRRIARVRVGDPRSRWGSCSSRGALAFSWRLILAPPEVLDYVIAHEIAHLIEFDHGPRFWALVRTLCGDCDAAKRWLAAHGPGLLRYG